MIFNAAGRLINTRFYMGGEPLEPVKSFCYLGFEVVPSGIVTRAMNILNDKGKKAMRPLLNTIARFKIPVKTAIKLFHTYIAPILLYNAENWFPMSDKEILKFKSDFFS